MNHCSNTNPHQALFVSAAFVSLLGFALPAHAQSEPAAVAAEPPGEVIPAEPPADVQPSPASAPAAPAPALPEVPSPSAPPEPKATATEPASWFDRTPLTATLGAGERQLSLTLYGFLQADYIYDTTRSYDDAIGTRLVQRTDTYAGTVGRTQFSTRNTRLGLLFVSPALSGLRPRAVFEGDFFGNQPEHASESELYDSPAFRLRHAYVHLENDYVDVLLGQTYDVFGWQNLFFPATAEFLGLPNQVFSRHTQLRLARTFGKAAPFGVTLAAAAVRPGQRDSQIPDVNAGLLLSLNGLRGITTKGNAGTEALPLSLGVSGTLRHFKVDAFTPPPTQTSNGVLGWGVSVDALLPVIPADNEDDRGNRLTLTGSFVTGSGIGDLLTVTGGATFPTLPNPAQANPPPEYHGNVDAGLVSFDTQGVLHTIDWQAFRVGLQYYLPPSGRFILAANYTQAHSKNLSDLFPRGGAEIELQSRVADKSLYADVNLFWDATPAVRLGVAGSYSKVEYLDGDSPDNIRGRAQALYFF